MPNGGRLGMNGRGCGRSSGSGDIWRLLAAMTLRKARTSAIRIIGRLDHLDGEGGIDDVAAGQAKVKPAACRGTRCFSATLVVKAMTS